MVQKTFEAREVVLSDVFSNDFRFTMPLYQRPYTWRTEETEELLNDLRSAMNDEPVEPYFLGSIVLISDSSSVEPMHEVIDGQQRLTTLTMLFCVLRELPTCIPQYRDSLNARVQETQDVLAGDRGRFRLALRETDREYFCGNVQERDKVQAFIQGGPPVNAPESQKRIFSNTKFLYDELSTWTKQERDEMSKFVTGSCYLVVVTAYNRDSAHRIFSVLNHRGIDLTPTDILKSDVIGAIPDENQGEYTELWEGIENDMGRDKFGELFAHIFMIETTNRSHKELGKAFEDSVLTMCNGAKFMDEILLPYSEALNIVTNLEYESASHAEEINRVLENLNSLDNDDWIPLAMMFYNKYKNEPLILLRLLKALDRLAYAMLITGFRRDPRITRYRSAITATQHDDLGSAEIVRCLDLTCKERDNVVNTLDEPVYTSRPVHRFARPLLLRLNSVLADDGVSYHYKVITVEHILPQNPEPESDWMEVFPDEDVRQKWTHRLANLVLLSRNKNSRASNYEFHKKKNAYFQQGGVTTFALTTQVVNETEWTPEVLERRQKELIEALKTEWHL